MGRCVKVAADDAYTLADRPSHGIAVDGKARPARDPPAGGGASRLPVVGVALVIALITIVAYYIYESNRRGAVTLSNDLITAIDRRVGAQMHSYLAPAQQFLELADAAAAGRGVFEGRQEIEASRSTPWARSSR